MCSDPLPTPVSYYRRTSSLEVGATKTAAELERRRDDVTSAPDHTHRRGVPTALVAVLGVLAGLLVAIVGPMLLSSDGGTPIPGAVPRTAPADAKAPADVLPDGPTPPGAGAASPSAALTSFLDAEVRRDYRTSFGFLDDVDRSTFGSPAGWVAAHANAIAPVVEYSMADVSERDGSASIAALVTFEPGLDQVVGLIPRQANVSWQVNRGTDGAWGVSLDSSAIEPIYPTADGALPAAQAWLDARRACSAPSNERAGLVGSPALAGPLCGAGPLTLGSVAPLTDLEAAPIATAFGAEARSAARLVRVSGAVDLGVVLVPIGDQWTVIGVVS
jgi:hypothetical protein